MNIIAVFIGGGVGSLLRYGISVGSKKMLDSDFPSGTLISNLLACAILALLVGVFADKLTSTWMKLMLVTGFCGGFSTFSTFGLETFELFKGGHTGMAIANILVSVVAGIIIFYFLSKSS